QVKKEKQTFCDFVAAPPCPIPPIGCEPLDRRTANQRPASAQVRSQPLEHSLRHFLVDPSVIFEREKAASNPGVVRLVPYAPVPIRHSLAAPLFNAAPHDVR